MASGRGLTEGSRELAAAILRVQGGLRSIPRRGFNEHFRYHYVTEEDLLEAVKPALAVEGLTLTFSMIEAPADLERPTGRGSTLVTTVPVQFTLVHAATGAALRAVVYGRGEDAADKGLSKATTSALKQFLLRTFLIASHEDPELTDRSHSAMRGGRQSLGQPRRRRDRPAETAAGPPPSTPPASSPAPAPEGPAAGPRPVEGELYLRALCRLAGKDREVSVEDRGKALRTLDKLDRREIDADGITRTVARLEDILTASGFSPEALLATRRGAEVGS